MKPLAVAVIALVTAGCGYHVGGHTGLLPKTVKTIAIPAFANTTTRNKLPVMLTGDLTREFNTRTRFRIVADPNQADAVLNGAIVNLSNYPTIFDPASGRATGVQVVVNVQIKLTERATGKVLFYRPRLEFRERYEITTDPQAYFDESDTALSRLSQDVARSILTAILEDF
jgi:outer membrane lipopolysaccharide assembly protein LptE/RlpB